MCLRPLTRYDAGTRRTLHRRSRKAATAVQTPVVCAGAARLYQPLVKRPPGPMHAHASVARRQALPLGKRHERLAFDVHILENFCVFRLQRSSQPGDTGTNLGRRVGQRLDVGGQLVGERLERTTCRCPSAVVVDGRVAKGPVEPGQQRLFWQHLHTFEITDERVLKEIFGQRPIADTALEVGQEGTVIGQQHLEVLPSVLRAGVVTHPADYDAGRAVPGSGTQQRMASEVHAVDNGEIASHLRRQILQVVEVVAVQGVRRVIQTQRDRVGQAV